MTKHKVCRIIIDSESRFDYYNTNNEIPMYKNLPHDKYGWNKFDAECIDNIIYYKKKKIIDLDTIKHCCKGLQSVTESDIKSTSDGDNSKIKHNSDEDSTIEPSEYDNKLYDYIWYYCFLSSDNDINDNENNVLSNTTLYFDNHPMTDAHIHFEIIIDDNNLK
jgi:hypothetical protein